MKGLIMTHGMTGWLSMVAMLFLAAPTTLCGEEVVCECQCETEVPILSKIPYLNRLFKNVAVSEPDDAADGTASGIRAIIFNHQDVAGDQPQRIGKTQRIGYHGSGIGANGKSCDVVGRQATGFQQPRSRHPGNQQAQLDGTGALQRLGRIQLG